MKFIYFKQPPRKYTFEMPKIKQYIEEISKGNVLNLFAGKIRLNINEIRVDIDNKYNPTYNMDAFKFIKTTNMKFDTIILDPPYNIRKAREKYNNNYIGSFTKIKNELVKIITKNGIIITFGYDSNGMSECRGFEKKEIWLICHGGDHNDTIVTVERKIYYGESLF